MPCRPYPLLLLMLALSLPASVHALGLGDIHVDSALNEPLSAQIDIIGATPEELTALRASIADKETFQRYNADRPQFLNSAKFKVGRDAQGRAVLLLRSQEAFTDPLVSLLVDLRWSRGQLVREYSLLLDPPNFGTPDDAARLADAATAPVAPPAAPAPVDHTPTPAHVSAAARDVMPPALAASAAAGTSAAAGGARYRVAAQDTLRGIARRSGTHSEAHVQRLMIAIFRANPHAFAGNINRLRRGVELTLPLPAAVAAIPAAEAEREVDAQLLAWRSDGRASASRSPALVPVTATAAVLTAPSLAPQTGTAAQAADAAQSAALPAEALKGRLQNLEESLDAMQRELASDDAKMLGLQRQIARAQSGDAPNASRAMAEAGTRWVPSAAAAERQPAGNANALSSHGLPIGWGPLAAIATALLAGFAWFRTRRLATLARPRQAPGEPTAVAAPELEQTQEMRAQTPPPHEFAAVTPNLPARTTMTATPTPPGIESRASTRTAPQAGPGAPTPEHTAADATDELALEAMALETLQFHADDDPYGIDDATNKLPIPPRAQAYAEAAFTPADLDFNTVDLGATGEHVQMPSGLHDHVVVAESRTNIVEVLKGAIERDPQRRDLRLKLLEVYYSAAASNQRAFLEMAGKLANERGQMSAAEWDKVTRMGREIGAKGPLFNAADQDDSQAVA